MWIDILVNILWILVIEIWTRENVTVLNIRYFTKLDSMEMKIVKYFMQIRDRIKIVFKYVSIVCQYQNSIFFRTENDIGKYFMEVTD